MDNDAKFNLLLGEMKNICNKIDEKFEEIDKRFEQIDKRFEQIDKRFEQIDKRFEQIDKRFEQIDFKFCQLEHRMDEISAEMGAVHRTLFKLDVDTQKNLNILSEAHKSHSDKEILFEKQLCRLTDQLDNNTYRISILEDAIVTS